VGATKVKHKASQGVTRRNDAVALESRRLWRARQIWAASRVVGMCRVQPNYSLVLPFANTFAGGASSRRTSQSATGRNGQCLLVGVCKYLRTREV
jgi:hypothetical protein